MLRKPSEEPNSDSNLQNLTQSVQEINHKGFCTMSISRDRLKRNLDPEELFLRRRDTMYVHTEGDEFDAFTPFRWGSTPLTGTDRITRLIGAPRVSRPGGFQTSYIGRENLSTALSFGLVRGRSQGRRSAASPLPSWYPRRPLQDITSIVRAMQARRAREREDEGLQLESPVAQDQSVQAPIASTSGAHLEHDISTSTPLPVAAKRHCPHTIRKLPKLLHDITNDDAGDMAFLTPQRKLLNSIEAVEKVLIEERQKWKSSPAVKKAEREKKVRTLMSMR